MSGIFNSIKEAMGFGADDELEDREDLDIEEDDDEQDNVIETPFTRKSSKVVNIHTAASAKIMITKPTEYEDALEICDAVKSRKVVVINTTSLDTKTAQRLLDFIAGSSYSLEGDIQEVEKGVYVVSPSTVQVTNELKNELSNKGLFNWNSKGTV